ncbi:unnamed protein product [Adineta steineri]|uniref:Ig-like domain-containing protein n=1 Tax=Adineta steineri TaxID=433720 RepID=A0A814QMF4_9BILA|nr:unnamed protein product [Adineta steineri]
MQFNIIIVHLVVLPWFVMCQIPLSNLGQYGSPIVGDVPQQQQQQNPSSNVQIPSPASSSNDNYLVGNLSESFTFQVAPPSIKVTYLGLNGFSLYIMGVGFSNKSKFNYDEQNNRLTILSLDSTTVGYYSAVDAHWKTFNNILSAINVSSLQIHNSHVSEDNNGSSLVSCSVSIIRSTFKLSESSSKSQGTENLPRLDLFLSTRQSSSSPLLSNNKIYNDTLYEQNFTRTITLQRPLTRADHNGTIQCQVESNNNIDVYLIKSVPIDIEYGPNLETGALPTVTLESEALKMIAMDCQIEANPTPSYVWYETLNNVSSGIIMSDYGQQNSYQQLPSIGQNVFGTTRQIQRIYQYPGQYGMQCQAQSRGKTVKQDFTISVHSQSNAMKTNSDVAGSREKSYKVPMIIGISIGSILILLITAIVIAAIIYLKRQKSDPDKKQSISAEKISNDKQGKSRWGGLPIDYSKYKHESLKADSSSTSHLVESAETNSIQVPPPIPARPSPMTSTHSSYRQAPSTSVSFSYRQASALPGFRPSMPTRPYSPEEEDADEVSTSINAIPLTTNRSRTNTPFGSHKSLSESIQSLRSNQQPALSLPVKKRVPEQPEILPKREQKPISNESKSDYQHHHYHNPAQLRAQQQTKLADNTSSEEEELETQQTNQTSEGSAITGSTTSGYNQVDFHQPNERRKITPPSPLQKNIVPQPTGIVHDEVPPSYNQISTKTSPSHAYIYQEPTEV